MGANLSIVGAYVLASQLTAHGDTATAFSRFQEQMQPYVASAQSIPASLIRLAYPKSRAGVTALRTVTRLAASKPAQKLALFDRAAQTSAGDFDLPDFDPGSHAGRAGRVRALPPWSPSGG